MFKNLLYLAILTSVVILSWIAFGVYHSYTTSTISQDSQILITPIPANFDQSTIDKITERTVVPADLGQTRSNAEKNASSSAGASESASLNGTGL